MKRVLLIDDDEDDRDFFLSVLEIIDPSIVCTTAADGAVALRNLIGERNLPDLIFLDLNMPVMNGKQFLREIKRNKYLEAIPVIVLSTSSDRETIAETTSLGAAYFITKPNKLSELEDSLKIVLSDPRYSQKP